MEAAPGLEPGITDLQSVALGHLAMPPLGFPVGIGKHTPGYGLVKVEWDGAGARIGDRRGSGGIGRRIGLKIRYL